VEQQGLQLMLERVTDDAETTLAGQCIPDLGGGYWKGTGLLICSWKEGIHQGGYNY